MTERAAADTDRATESRSAPADGEAAERFIPDAMRGGLVEAEHLARYALAAKLAGGRRVLDAACGTGYGSSMLAAGGAAAVTGVDIDPGAFDASAAPGCELLAGDIRALEFADDSFDLVVSFETIEHVEDPLGAIDELARVTADGGWLLVSSPNRGAIPEGNPYHLHELTADELIGALRERFANVMPLRQHNWVASAIFDDAQFAGADLAEPLHSDVRKVHAAEPGSELYTLALAGNGPLPEIAAQLVVTSGLEVRAWLDEIEKRRAEAGALRDELEAERATSQARIAELQDVVAWVEDNELYLRDAAERRAFVRGLLGAWARCRRIARKVRAKLR